MALKSTQSKTFLNVAGRLSNNRSSSASPCRHLVRQRELTTGFGHLNNISQNKNENLIRIAAQASRSLHVPRMVKNNYSTSTSNNTAGSSGSSSSNANNGPSSGYIRNTLKYSIAVALGTSAGLFTGYYLMLDQYKVVYDDRNQASRHFLPDEFHSTRNVNEVF